MKNELHFNMFMLHNLFNILWSIVSGTSSRAKRAPPATYVDRAILPQVYQCFFPKCKAPPPPPPPGKRPLTSVYWSDIAAWEFTPAGKSPISVIQITYLSVCMHEVSQSSTYIEMVFLFFFNQGSLKLWTFNSTILCLHFAGLPYSYKLIGVMISYISNFHTASPFLFRLGR